MQRPRIAVLGASGYAGVELSRLIALHPEVELAVAGSDRWADASVEAKIGVPAPGLRYAAPDRALEHAASCGAVLLATPAEISHAWVPQLRAAGVLVIDLSGAFRLRDAAQYPRHYTFVHQHPALLAEAVYGLPELFRERIAGAKLIANPGCYATAIQLALAPIAKLADHWAVSAVSGVTGAGRKATEEMSFVEVANDVRAYRALRHQHAPEIAQGLGAEVAFVPHLIPVARGILATCHARIEGDISAAMQRYVGEPFVELAANADDVGLHHVVGTNKCRIGWTQHGRDVVVTAAIDNLVKGAAGQAVQNLNLALGFPETTGLVLRGFHP